VADLAGDEWKIVNSNRSPGSRFKGAGLLNAKCQVQSLIDRSDPRTLQSKSWSSCAFLEEPVGIRIPAHHHHPKDPKGFQWPWNHTDFFRPMFTIWAEISEMRIGMNAPKPGMKPGEAVA